MEIYILFICISTTTILLTTAVIGKPPKHLADSEIITEPLPGQEYVFVQTGLGDSSTERRTKLKSTQFETSHKIPSITSSNTGHHKKHYSKQYNTNNDPDSDHNQQHGLQKREADSPAPVPAGAIKLNVNKLLQKYREELRSNPTSSTTQKPTTKKRTKKEVIPNSAAEVVAEVTSSAPTVLTTAAPTSKRAAIDDDIPTVEANGSQKQRSRIQIKKGPNGQEYEYEYVYYYYDDEDADTDKKPTPETNTNVHDDGPKITSAGKAPTVEANEVLPLDSNKLGGSKSRARQLDDNNGGVETVVAGGVAEDRLPANTRFPPRSRNLNTTPVSAENKDEELVSKSHGKQQRNTETPSAAESTEEDRSKSEETQNRSRTRANLRRPSLDLVDNASFNTHSSNSNLGLLQAVSGPSFPAQLPSGPVRFLGATPNESVDIPIAVENASTPPAKLDGTTSVTEDGSTTITGVTSAMDKAALDLYAILQGTQKLHGASSETANENESVLTTNSIGKSETTFADDHTVATTVIVPIVKSITASATTTTTAQTTTTQATSGETNVNLVGGRRYKGRGNRKTNTNSNHEAKSTSNSDEELPRSNGGSKHHHRPTFGANRPRSSFSSRTTTAEPSSEDNHNKDSTTRSINNGGHINKARYPPRPRIRPSSSTPTTVQENVDNSEVSSKAPVAPRVRPNYNLRGRIRSTTTAPAATHNEDDVTTPKPKRFNAVSSAGGTRPLRPGPRLNLIGGGRSRSSTTTSTTKTSQSVGAVSNEEVVLEEVGGDIVKEQQDGGDASSSTLSTTTVDNSPLGRLKHRHRLVVHQPNKAKVAASAPIPVRRVNPLIGRRRLPGQLEQSTTAAATASETPQIGDDAEEHAEEHDEIGEHVGEVTVTPTAITTTTTATTTEEPRGLSRLLAGRRRLALKPNPHQH